MIKIDKNVEMPARTGGGRSCKYPFYTMVVGDSFISDTGHAAVAGMAWAKRNNSDWAFSTRKEGDKYRVWRTK